MSTKSTNWLLLLFLLTGCALQKGDWGLEGIDAMETPPDPPLSCGMVVPPNPLAEERLSCTFGTGSRPAETLGVDPQVLADLPIRHVIVAMRENRSFDHLLGQLHVRGQPGVEPIPSTFSNPDRNGVAVFPTHASTTCIPFDPGHQSASMSKSIDDGRMDGFVLNAAQTTASDGTFVMGYYDQGDLPFYYWLATTFAVGDRYFAPMASGTFANRNFLLFGTHAGVVDTGIVHPDPSTPSILQLLMNAKMTWGVYSDGAPFSSSLGWTAHDPGVHTLHELYDALDQGTLPNVAFVDGVENVDDDHPTADLQVGEAWLKALYDHAVVSPQWSRLAIVWTYDEGGGFADHVPPEPPGCASEPGSPFIQRGVRIPVVMISPWAKHGYVSHVVRDHTAITRLIEALFDLPALTPRDANSDALLDLFDFSCGIDPTPPAAPNPGQGGCTR
jgi:phospholipase C